MARTRTVEFLPQIFQTSTNRQFLSATLDQLVQEPQYKKTQGFVGRRIGPGVNPNDSYVIEPDKSRTDYQLEPGVAKLDADRNNVVDVITYPGINDALAVNGANTTRADRLYSSEYYSWDPFINFDKFVNFSQYYWLPAGPNSVDVSASPVPLTDDFDVTRNDTSYSFSGLAGTDPVITLLRGGNYTFNVLQPGNNFWIQTDPGVNGRIPSTPNISSRDVLGVSNNGADVGTVTFNVPLKNAQQFYYDLPSIGSVDLVTDLKFNEINNVYVAEFLAKYQGIDGITSLDNRTVIFTNPIVDATEGGWLITTQFDPLSQVTTNNGLPGSYDSIPFDLTVPIPESDRYDIWLIRYQTDSDGNAILKLTKQRTVNKYQKFNILFGNQWSNTQWYKNAEFEFEQIPLLSAIKDTLYYQDSSSTDIVGVIRLVDAVENDTLFIEDILGKPNYTAPNGVVFTNGLKVQFRGQVIPASYENQEYYVAGVGTAIKLLPVVDYLTPETYTQSATILYDSLPYDEGNYDASLNQPLVPDYLTIALDSPDLNPWTRSNRWFHVDVINASARYNNLEPVFDNQFRAKRPIIEFRGGTRLFNMGTQGKTPVDIIDFEETDALSNINGSVGYAVDGYQFITGSRVIFAADVDPQVRNKIYVVNYIEPTKETDNSTIPGNLVINLTPASDAEVLFDQCVYSLSGIVQQGKSFYYDGAAWIESQQKTSANQAPLFDVYDAQGISYGNRSVYPSSTFVGSKLFSYAVGQGVADSVLGFPLRYLSLANVGDIVFDNNLYSDSFVYVRDSVSFEQPISAGFVREYRSRLDFELEIGWQTAATQSQTYQQFNFVYQTNTPLILDIPVSAEVKVPAVKIYVGSVFLDPGEYSYSVVKNNTYITLPGNLTPGIDIEVLALSTKASTVGFYQVPINLENNPLNENAGQFTLGTIRTHYQTIAQNLVNFTGLINGANNIRDLGNVVPYGLNILQQSSPLTLTGYFSRSQEYNLCQAIEFNSREYEKFKARLLNAATQRDWENLSSSQILDQLFVELSIGKTENDPFYWSDMLPVGSVVVTNTVAVTPITTNTFDTVNVYNFKSSNYQGLLVYVNDTLLVRNRDYVVATDGPRITITVPLAVGNRVTIQEYSRTYGTFVPNTPTKMGLYPAYEPEIYVDETYITPTTVIRGHDGSITVAFGDFRDQVLLEFEKRVFNNLKLDDNPIPLLADDVIPGQFRTTEYSLAEVTELLGVDFLNWVGWNKLDYTAQDFNINDSRTWNYSTASNKLTNNRPLAVGARRGIYNFFYDTIYPNSRPWELLGFTVKPQWWENAYGPAPYTSGNLVLWEDLEAGFVRDPDGGYFIEKYVRPGLTQVIPSGSEGALLSPIDSVVGNYNQTDFRKSWVVGDDGPVESAWRTSSSYPFAVMKMLSLTKPAQFFSLFADRDLYRFDAALNQYLYNGRYRLDANGVEVYGNGVSKASYINWIVDYARRSGINATSTLTTDLASLDVRLCYRMASFSAKNLLQVYTEKSSPNSLNSSLLLPDESYNLLLYKNVPFDELTYSSVIVQKVETGFAVYGYGTAKSYFSILASRAQGLTEIITAGGVSVTVPTEYTKNIVRVPYGYVFTSSAAVADFLLSYGQLLERQGLQFEAQENGYILNWKQMAREFLYWTAQGWGVSSVINLNPLATQLVVERPLAIVDNISVQTQEAVLLDQNKQQLPVRELIVDRENNRFTLTTSNEKTINFCNLKFVSTEHLVVLDNQSIFADLIYQPVTGARQSRVRVVGYTTTEWNGQLDAQGFILNQDNIQEWQPLKKYTRGEIVEYKNLYYSALDFIEPSNVFNFNQWARSDYTQIQQGLLPNLANKSDQLAGTYSVYQANLEQDQDIFSYGLIGFRPRQYMTALNLDDVSQVNLYRQFLGTKGTIQAAELFSFADLGRGNAQFDIFENWAVQRAVYGANANRSFYELRLNEALLKSNPGLIEIVNTDQASEADQTVLVNNIWRQSYKFTTPDVLTTTSVPITDTALPSAGYANFDDADITIFDVNSPAEINAQLEKIIVGNTVWAAKINEYDWGIFRVVGITGSVVQLVDNLDGTSTVSFSTQHGLTANSIVIIKSFDLAFDGAYVVLSTPSLTSINVAYSFATSNQTITVGDGVAFKLQTQKVKQASDILGLPFADSLVPGTKVWVDDNGNGQWTVLQKQQVFDSTSVITARDPVTNSNYGVSVSQAAENLFALVGASDYNSGSGAAYTYVRTDFSPYVQNSYLELTAANTVGFGHCVDVGNQTWSVVGAPASENSIGYAASIYRTPGTASFIPVNLLLPHDPRDLVSSAEFGYSAVVSQDEQWMYVGAPGLNAVYAYGKVEIEAQSVTYATDGITSIYNYSNSIIIDLGADQQLNVILNNQVLTYGVDYTVNENNVVLVYVPPKDLVLRISRRDAVSFTGDGSTVTYSLNEYLYNVTDVYSFTVTIDGVLQRPHLDYDFNADDSTVGKDITFLTAPTDGSQIDIVTRDHYTFVDKIQHQVAFVGSILNGLLTVTDINASGPSLTTGMILTGPDLPQGTTITAFVTGTGYTGTYLLNQSFTTGEIDLVAQLPVGARFGQSISCTTDGRQILIGAPFDNQGTLEKCGAVYAYDRLVQKFIVTDTSQLTYTVAGGQLIAPTDVQLNQEFLTNQAGNLTGDFTVSGAAVTLNVPLTVGDEIEVGVNSFKLLQKILADTPTTESEYGIALDICPNNCSLYNGAPGNGSSIPQQGQVERRVNQSRVYGIIISLNPNPTLIAGSTIRINNVEVAVPAAPDNDINGLALAINQAGIPNVVARIGIAGTETAGRLALAVKNSNAAVEFEKLSVQPGQIGDAFERLGFDTYSFTQTIQSPFPKLNSGFGSAVTVNTAADTLIVSAPRGTAYRAEVYDGGTTYFDSKATTFFSTVVESGVVYTFDYLPSAVDQISEPGNFVFGQQIYDNFITPLDKFGTSVNYRNGVLMVGSPDADLGDSSALDYGRVTLFNNPTQRPAWTPIRVQQPVVDTQLINSVFTYDIVTGAKTSFFDFFDPLQGKILGAARQNIDYIGAVDPAAYNIGVLNNYGKYWAAERVGEIWWDTNNVRFIDPNQDDIVYASRRWGQVFPGSRIQVYQWVISDVPPANYTGPGIPRSIESYAISNSVDNLGVFRTSYFFWVSDVTSVNTAAKKTLSTTGIARYIENPRGSGIPYVAFINASTTAIYNAIDLISAQDTVLHIEFDRELNNDNVHVEYELIPENRADGFLNSSLFRKLLDSLCGVDTAGNLVPDPLLSPANRYGVQFRPRQSMFSDRFTALKNYLTRVNSVLLQYPISETRSFRLLNSQDPIPSSASGEWDKRVANLEELSYQNLLLVPVGYRYLVESDSREDGLWAIYQVTETKTFESLQLTRVQTYKTSSYWSYVDWFKPGYNSSSIVSAEVANVGALETISAPIGSTVVVRANSQGKYEYYLLTDQGWERVGLEDGTIEFSAELWDYAQGRFGFDVEVFDSQYYDQYPSTETRKIVESINQELLIGELLIERNRALVLLFNYVLTEFNAPEWLVKTSLVDVDHRIRELRPYQIYQQDNQEFVIDYIQEVKPYHVQVREFNLIYDGIDTYQGSVADFDVPAYWNSSLLIPQFVSPVLTPYTASDAVGTGRQDTTSDTPASSALWQQQPWSFWFNNYKLSIESVQVINSGAGYRVPPEVVVTGDAIRPAVMTATINSVGHVTEIVVQDPGEGYLTTPVITISGGNGEGARAVAITTNGKVRSIKTTIKFDRYQYQSDVETWQSDESYTAGTLVRYIDRVWQADANVAPGTFDPADWSLVDQSTLSGVDRTMGLYVPTVNLPGLDLALLIDGIDYPGVQVDAPSFSQNTGFDVGNFDVNPYDNLAFGPEGRPTYDPGILDAVYESNFLDVFLGTRPTDINVEGGEFVDTYSSHAPEELVPGSEFDTLDMRVYTRPGSDWQENGHGFRTETIKWVYSSLDRTQSFADLMPNPVQVRVINQTQQRDLIPLIDYTINWVSLSVTVPTNLNNPAANNGDVLVINAYGIGGGSQLYKNSFLGQDVGNQLTVPVNFNEIDEFAIFVNGVFTDEYSYSAVGSSTEILFSNTYSAGDSINVTALGFTDDSSAYTWSTPVTQYFIADGIDLDFVVDYSMQGTNPANLIVERNGIRARPAEGIVYTADGSTAYELPTRGGYSQSLVADNDVRVWVNDQQLTLGTDYTVEPYTSDDDIRAVEFATAPSIGSQVLISVSTRADYTVETDGSSLNYNIVKFKSTGGFIPLAGDVIAVTTWNDTAQQDIVTLVFNGPVTEGVLVSQNYDMTDYDDGDITGLPGSFDYGEGTQVTRNNFQLGSPVTDPSRLWVTVNGQRRFFGDDYLVVGTELILHGPVISTTDVVVIERFTDSIVPEALAFRIFQDMRGIQATYRITSGTTTQLASPLRSTDQAIHVDNARALTQPDLTKNVWGVLTIGGERIMYRSIDFATNTVSSLLRGTAGTAISDHAESALVYNMGRGNLLMEQYQDRIVETTTMANGTDTVFYAPNIDVSQSDSTEQDRAVQVLVGGIVQSQGYSLIDASPVTVQFSVAPPEGVDVTIFVRQGLSWYEPGTSTASNGVALQETNTEAARFFRGE